MWTAGDLWLTPFDPNQCADPLASRSLADERVERGAPREPIRHRSESAGGRVGAIPHRRRRPLAPRERVSYPAWRSGARGPRAARHVATGARAPVRLVGALSWPRSRPARAMSRSCGCCRSRACFAATGRTPDAGCATPRPISAPVSPHSQSAPARRIPCGRLRRAQRRPRGSAHARGWQSTAAACCRHRPCRSTIPARG